MQLIITASRKYIIIIVCTCLILLWDCDFIFKTEPLSVREISVISAARSCHHGNHTWERERGRERHRQNNYTIKQLKEQVKHSPVDAGTAAPSVPQLKGTMSVTVTFDTNIAQRTAFWSLHVSCHLSRVEEIRVLYSISPEAHNFAQEPLWLRVWTHTHKYTHTSFISVTKSIHIFTLSLSISSFTM